MYRFIHLATVIEFSDCGLKTMTGAFCREMNTHSLFSEMSQFGGITEVPVSLISQHVFLTGRGRPQWLSRGSKTWTRSPKNKDTSGGEGERNDVLGGGNAT